MKNKILLEEFKLQSSLQGRWLTKYEGITIELPELTRNTMVILPTVLPDCDLNLEAGEIIN